MTEKQIAKMIIDETNAELKTNPMWKGMMCGPVFLCFSNAIAKAIVKALDDRMDRIRMETV
jgi:hypothetical protein